VGCRCQEGGREGRLRSRSRHRTLVRGFSKIALPGIPRQGLFLEFHLGPQIDGRCFDAPVAVRDLAL
jgi:hypothetical protein